MNIRELKKRLATIPDHVEITSREYREIGDGWTSQRSETTELEDVHFEGDGSDYDVAVFNFRIMEHAQEEEEEKEPSKPGWIALTAAILLAARVYQDQKGALRAAANLVDVAAFHLKGVQERMTLEARATQASGTTPPPRTALDRYLAGEE